MPHAQSSYEELERRCREAEALLEAVRSGRIQTIAGEEGTILGRLAEVEERAAHIKQVLLAIRNVNQLIVQETDPRRLIERACALLTETMGYFNAWIALLDDTGKAVNLVVAAGFDGGFEILRERLERGEFPSCMTQALAQDTPVVVEDPPSGCPACPMASEYGGRAGLAHRLVFGGRLFGVLAVSVPAAYAHDDEEQSLFQEVAGDLAFALHKIDLEARNLSERMQAERSLKSAYTKLQAIWSVASLPDASVKNVTDHILDSIVRMTESQYGFYGFVNDDESVMAIHAWSGEAMRNCSLVDNPRYFPVNQAGVWAEAIRRRASLIVNDYADTHEAKKGLPQGHVPLTNLLVVPFFSYGKITAVAAVANRPTDYTAEDAEQLTSFLNSVQAVTEGKRAEEALRNQNRLLEAIREAQTLSLVHDDSRVVFKHLLDTLVNLTESQYGFLDEVCRDPKGEVYKRSLALSDISWDESSRNLYESLVTRHLEFRNLKNLAGAPVTTGRMVIANEPARDERSGGLPSGHPPLAAFMGIPLYYDGELVGVAGIANRPGGYTEEISAFLEPFTNACAAIIQAKRVNEREQQMAHIVQESENKFRTLFEHSPVPIWVEDFSAGKARLDELRAAGVHDLRSYLADHPDEVEYLAQLMTLREANRASVTILKVRSAEDLMIPLSSFFVPESWNAFREIVIGLAEGRSTFEIEMPFRDMPNARMDIYLRLSVAPGYEDTLSRIFVSFIDITERKWAERILADMARQWQQTFDAVSDSVWLLDRDSRVVRCNKSGGSLIEQEIGRILGRRCWEVVHGTSGPIPECPALRMRETLRRESVEMPLGDRWCEVTVDPLLDEAGTLTGAVHVVSDITERKRAEQALRESEMRYRRIVDAAQEGIWVMDAERRTTFVNPRMAAMLGYSIKEMLGRVFEEFMYDEDLPDHVQHIRERHQGRASRYERRFRHQDGREIWTSVSAVAVMDDEGRFAGSFGMFTDITERKRAEEERLRLEEQLRQLQKLDAAGRLAAGFAHDFNNLLSVIQSQMHQVHLASGLDGPTRESLAMIDKATGQAVALTQALRTFGHGLPTQKQVVDLRAVVREAEPFLRHCLPARVQVEVVIKDEACPVMADPSQLHQVMLNLALNARDAMPDGGRLRVTVAKFQTAEIPFADKGKAAVAGYVRLSFSDTGGGMPPETLDRVFEPFFSTKPHGQGTGLGLLIVHGIVKDHAGQIQIESRVNKGTTVHIVLPAISQIATADAGMPPVEGKGELILLVGGNPYLRGTIAAYLDSLNYRVLLGDDEGLVPGLWSRHRAEVRLVILGADASSDRATSDLQAIRADEPGVPAIILCDKANIVQVAECDQTIILTEPYRMIDLAGAVAKIFTVRTT